MIRIDPQDIHAFTHYALQPDGFLDRLWHKLKHSPTLFLLTAKRKVLWFISMATYSSGDPNPARPEEARRAS